RGGALDVARHRQLDQEPLLRPRTPAGRREGVGRPHQSTAPVLRWANDQAHLLSVGERRRDRRREDGAWRSFSKAAKRLFPSLRKIRMPLPPLIGSREIHPRPLRRQPHIPGPPQPLQKRPNPPRFMYRHHSSPERGGRPPQVVEGPSPAQAY